MSNGKTLRTINGIRCHCLDVGADDYEKAARNRDMIANHKNTTNYEMVESAVEHTPLRLPLASWIPSGNLPQVGKADWKQYGGGRSNIFELEPISVVGEQPDPTDDRDLTSDKGDVVQ